MGAVTSVTVPSETTGANAPAPAAQPAADRPAWLPEKFKSPEDMAKAYSELETKLGQPKPTATPAAEPAKQPDNKIPTLDATKPPAKVDLSKYEQEFSTTGKLSDQSFAELEAAGYPKAVVEQYINGQAAAARQIQTDVFNSVGGEAEFKTMLTWADQNLSPTEKEAYNRAVQSGHVEMAKLAVAGISAKFKAAVGSNPSLVGGRANANTGPQPYGSWAQVSTAMADKRYSTDEAYRKDVEARIAVSKL